MAPSREIEKLQRRWQENPLGLTFAPLAEAYRKEAMFADALDLLNIGLAQHPNYVPAHIVRGRCFLDSGADQAAENAFRRVIDIDPENVIALKSLAEIAERAGRYDDAIGRLERLLEFDRSNDEAQAQLDGLRAARAIPQPGEIELAASLEPAGAGEPPVAPGPSEAATTVEPPVPTAEAEPITLDPVSLGDAALSDVEVPADTEITAAALAEPVPSVPVLEEAVQVSDDVPAGPSLEVAIDEGAAEEPPAEPVAASVVEAPDDVEVVLFNPIELSAAAESEFRVPDASGELRPGAGDREDLGLEAAPPEALPEPSAASGLGAESFAAPDVPAVAFEAAAVEPVAEAAAEPAEERPAVEAAAGPAGDEAVPAVDPAVAATAPTESDEEIAEYEVSTDQDDAEAVAGVEAEPELVVTETMAELFLRQGHRELALAVYTQLIGREPDNVRIRGAIESLRQELEPAGPAPGLPGFAAMLTGGQSVRALFEQVLSARRPAPVADDGLSLGAVFGEAAALPRSSATAAPAGPSYDEFYADDAGDALPAPAPAAREPEADPAADDLESFTSWLKGLKR